ncbi:protein clustered with O-phosphoseryl-tRNA(Cys) synthetase [Methanococcoides sp. SA1]|nr:protein clustered with O-phosphoseryl-tRNA(Cys) synthetase [Methanococcoides sp. SA1]
MFTEIAKLMDDGEAVCVTFQEGDIGEEYDLLYCEMITKARKGESFLAASQSCPPGKYVLSRSEDKPDKYYLASGRYIDAETAQKAVSALPRIKKKYDHIRIEPLSENNGEFDVIILYLKPEIAMRVVQALAYNNGDRVCINTFGAASICGDCTALAIENGIGLSYGCKGSRKHSEYSDNEIPIGIDLENAKKIEKGLKNIPKTRH